MDNSDDNYSDQGDEFDYDPTPFYTDQAFNSHEELTDWAQATGRSLGYVLVKGRSNKNSVGLLHRVLLMCDRGGVYRDGGSSGARSTSTKKINCPFKLQGYLTESYDWRVNVKEHRHNHLRADYFEGHAYARRFSVDEKYWLEQAAKLNLQPRDIFAGLKREFPNNVSTIKDIYNALEIIKDEAAEQVGDTPMQVLLSVLHANHYTYDYTTDSSNRMENLFFIHPKSFEMWRAFPYVLIIDATYKTNIYGMPFVEIVGVTSTSKTFCIACAFVKNETTAIYKWVLECLKQTLGEGMDVRVIITDRELALMNACQDVLPDVARQLCRYHIRQNIIKNCQSQFRKTHDFDSFLHRWEVLIESRTHQEYIARDNALKSYLRDYPGVYRYVEASWLSSYKEMFVSCWVDEHLNFRNYTTNRVESEHALLKTHLGGKARPHRLVECIGHIVTSQETAIKESFERSKINRKHEHNLPCFKLLHGVVSHNALQILAEEHQRLKDEDLLVEDTTRCGCKVSNSCGLPCACQITVYLYYGRCIPLDSIDIFWRKLDFTPCMQGNDISKTQDDDDMVDEALDNFKEAIKFQPKSVKKNWLKRLKDIINPRKTEIKEPAVQKNTRGRPSLQKKPSIKLPDLNKTPLTRAPSMLEKSRSTHSYGVERTSGASNLNDWKRAPARHSSHITSVPRYGPDRERHSSYLPTQSRFDVPQDQIPADIASQIFTELFEAPTTQSSYVPTQSRFDVPLSQLPEVFHPYVARIVNVGSDGNCGFRALAVALGYDEHKYFEWVRKEMLAEYDSKKEFYNGMFNPRDPVHLSLQMSYPQGRPEEYWMQIPEGPILLANRLGLVINCISLSGSSTVFPFWRGPDEVEPHQPISIALIYGKSHYVMVELQGDYPMATITPYWVPRHISPSASRWEVVYQERLDLYKRLTSRPHVHVDITSTSDSQSIF